MGGSNPPSASSCASAVPGLAMRSAEVASFSGKVPTGCKRDLSSREPQPCCAPTARSRSGCRYCGSWKTLSLTRRSPRTSSACRRRVLKDSSLSSTCRPVHLHEDTVWKERQSILTGVPKPLVVICEGERSVRLSRCTSSQSLEDAHLRSADRTPPPAQGTAGRA